MIFQHFLLKDANESNVYLVGCPETTEAAIIDAGAFDPRVEAFTRENNLSVKIVILTHGHWDHADGLDEYLKLFHCEYLAARDLGKSRMPARTLKEGDAVSVGRLIFQVFDTSGHTPDSISLHCASENIVFTGDALFAGSVGGTSSEDNRRRELGNIREKLLALAPETVVYSGHGPATTIGIEKTHNVFLKE